ncbi:MAG: glycoside hydrolase family 28 protein [Tannerella sp.]|jgi:hypothetical protein|nr:glycoside hydrolase family 28 protein [Tannerella sp.]
MTGLWIKQTLLGLAGMIFLLPSASAQQLNVYPIPDRWNYDFTVCVRQPGGAWQSLDECAVTVDMHNPQEASMVQFDFEGKVEMRVKVNNGRVNDVKIRPLARKIKPKVKGNFIYFTLTEPAKLSLEVNGDRLHNLHIFANAMEKEKYNRGDPNVMYFSGLNKPKNSPDTVYRIPSNTIVYFAPGSVVYGKFVCDSVENVRFLGRGIIMQQERGFEITFSRNIEIDGITVINPRHYTVFGGQTTGLKINNLKSFSAKVWSDGIDLMSCSDVVINDIFMRNSDDCIAIYGHRWRYFGDVRNYTVTHAILWADVAHPINIGSHGDARDNSEGEVIENLRFSNLDILEHDEKCDYFHGCMAFSVADKNLARNITFEHVRVESMLEGQLFNLRVLYNPTWGPGCPGRGIENITFRNIYSNAVDAFPSVIEGYDENRRIKNITFENIVINGKRAKTLREAGLKTGKYVDHVIVK